MLVVWHGICLLKGGAKKNSRSRSRNIRIRSMLPLEVKAVATITKSDVEITVRGLYKAGKEFPQKELFYSVDKEHRVQEATRIILETVDLFVRVFIPRNISRERWQKAEGIAIVSPERVICPALMQAALKQAETEHVEATISRNEEAKKERPANYADTKEGRSNAKLLRWTLSRMRQGRVFGPYWPTAKEVADIAEQIGMTANDVDNYNELLLRIFLNDVNYGKEHPEFILDYFPYFDKHREVSFRKVA